MIRPFFKNAGILAAAEILSRLKGLILLPLLTHRLGAAGYGAWAQVVVLVTLLVPVLILGTDSGVIRYLPGTDREERTRRFVGWMIGVSILAGVLCTLLAIFRRPLASVMFGSPGVYAQYVPLAAASIAATIVLNFSRTWFRLENNARWLASIPIAQAVLSTLAFVAWYLQDKGTYGFILYSVISDAVLAVALLLLLALRTGVIRPDFSLMPQLVRYGAWLLPAGYAVWALNWADRVILLSYTTLEAVGIYSLAYNLGYLLIQVVVSPIWQMFPNVAAELWNTGRPEAVQSLFERTAGAVLLLILPAVAGGAVLGGGLLRILAPPSFAGAASVLPLILGGYLLFILSAYYETVFGLVGRQGLGAVTVVIACAVNIGLNFLLIPRFSYKGAAVATTAAFAVELLLCIALSRRLGTLRTPWWGPLRMIVAASVMAVALWPVRGAFVGHGVLALGAGILCAMLIYGALCLLFGVVKPATVFAEAQRILTRRRLAGAGA